MFAAFRNALAARRAAVLEAEAMIANFDYSGLRQAMDRAADPMFRTTSGCTTSGSF